MTDSTQQAQAVVTPEAVEAAAKAMFPQGWYDLPETPAKRRSRAGALELARAALEAAQPHMPSAWRKCASICACLCHDTGGSAGDHPSGYCPGKDLPRG